MDQQINQTSEHDRAETRPNRPNSLWRALCSWWTIRLAGAIALVWFLVRVIPKPSRATYPCQRAAFPLASGFVIWVMSAFASVTAWRKVKRFRHDARWRMAGLCMLVAILGAIGIIAWLPEGSILAQGGTSAVFTPTEPANSPMGTAFGIKPGRVAWAFDPDATTWDGTSNAPGWWDDSNTHPEPVSAMLSAIVQSVGDSATDKLAWQKIFTDFNQRHGRSGTGYTKGEKIAIKLNLNQCRSQGDNGNASYIAPQLVEALLAQLVNDAGVAPSDITCYDAIRQVPSTIFDRCTKAFPGVRFVDSVGGAGREKVAADPSKKLVLAGGNETFYFPTCVTEATYLINVAGLKGHTIAGMTVCAKNHLGSFLTDRGAAGAPQIHRYITVRGGRGGVQPMGAYNGLVDLNGHEQLGGKTVLYLIDGLYATQTNETRLTPACKWQSAPFNGNWTASLFASQDEVAIDSVALDFLRNEPSLSVVNGAVDNYLHEMALAGEAPSKVAYDPEKDGKPLASMGVHEHWNNPAEKQYSRNLGAGRGIELTQTRPTAMAHR